MRALGISIHIGFEIFEPAASLISLGILIAFIVDLLKRIELLTSIT